MWGEGASPFFFFPPLTRLATNVTGHREVVGRLNRLLRLCGSLAELGGCLETPGVGGRDGNPLLGLLDCCMFGQTWFACCRSPQPPSPESCHESANR